MKRIIGVPFLNIYKRSLYNCHYHHNQRTTTTTLCLATTAMAFVFGFTVGVLLPIYVFTNSSVNFDPDVREFPVWNRTDNPVSEPTLQLISPLNTIINASSILSVLLPNKNENEFGEIYQNKFYSKYVEDSATTSPVASVNYFPSFLKSLINKRTKDVPVKKQVDIVPNNGIFWSAEIERQLPKGFDEKAFDDWRHFVNRSVVVKVEEGCGRMQNRRVTFDDGVKACCRYRQNNDQIQGEIFSFYLARLLGIENLPPSALAIVRGNEWQWDYVRSYIQLAQWSADRPVVLTRFVDKLSPSYIPGVFRNSSRRLHPLERDLKGKTARELVELVQWSDLIVFDYLTANLDRVVNNMYNEQWNSEMMKSPAHNLAKSDSTGLLVFLDNESGLLHGYRLLDKYEHYHLSLLKSLCLFKHSTVRALEILRNKRNVSYLLKEMFEKVSPHMRDWLPFIPDRYLKILADRIETVYQHVLTCHERYGSGDIPWTVAKESQNVVHRNVTF